MNKKRFIAEVACGAILFAGGLCGGYAYANRNLGVQGELRDARNKLEHYMLNDAMTNGTLPCPLYHLESGKLRKH